jgi:hypothetical protein
MTSLIDRLVRLWAEPLPEGAAAESAFRELYADPVIVNGAELSVADLVARARSLQRAFDGFHTEVVDRVEVPGRAVVAFVTRGRHTGPLSTPLGTVAPTGRTVVIRTIDVFTLTDGLISNVWAVSDELGVLGQLDAVTLSRTPPPGT